MINCKDLKNKAADRKKQNSVFFKKLKKKKPADLDVKMQDIHNKTFQHIDCLNCANCCKSISPILIDKDIQRIARHLRMKPAKFAETYLLKDEDEDYVYKETPCPFLMKDNYCSIYSVRPKACREYPHTDRKRFIQILNLTLKNTFICPAVFEMIEKLKDEYSHL